MKALMRTVTGREAVQVTQDLDATIFEVSKYGRPSVFQLNDGRWHASVKVNNSAAQTTVEVKAIESSIRGACEQLLRNVKRTVKGLGGDV